VLYHSAEQAGTAAGLDLRDPIDVRHAVQVRIDGNRMIDVGTPPGSIAPCPCCGHSPGR
jgi:hypothetical protein